MIKIYNNIPFYTNTFFCGGVSILFGKKDHYFENVPLEFSIVQYENIKNI